MQYQGPWMLGPPWSWSYGSWIYNYLRNRCLSSLMLWAVADTTLCDTVCQWYNIMWYDTVCQWYNIMWYSLSVIQHYVIQFVSDTTLCDTVCQWYNIMWYSLSVIQHYVIQFVSDTTLCDTVCQWFATDRWFSLCTPVCSTNKTDRHDITEVLLKMELNIINLNQ
jgi:hypothetical protein